MDLDKERLGKDIGYWMTQAPYGAEAYCENNKTWCKWAEDNLTLFSDMRDKWLRPLSKEQMFNTEVCLIYKPKVDFDITIDITDLNVVQINLSIEAFEKLGIMRVSDTLVHSKAEILSNACFSKNVTHCLLWGNKGDNSITFTYQELLSLANLYDYIEKATDTNKSNNDESIDDSPKMPHGTPTIKKDNIDMKLSTTNFYQHSLFAPAGKVFIDNPAEFAKIFDHEYSILMGGRVLRWTETHMNYSSDIPADAWYSLLEEVLVDE